MGTKARKETADGYESHFGTNYMAPTLLTLLLLPHIRAPEGAHRTAASSAPTPCMPSRGLIAAAPAASMPATSSVLGSFRPRCS